MYDNQQYGKTEYYPPHLGFFLMSSNWPTTWDTLVRTILKAISSSPIISNLLRNQGLRVKYLLQLLGPICKYWHKFVYRSKLQRNYWKKHSLVFILVSECFVNPFCNGFAVKDQAFCDRWLYIKKTQHHSQVYRLKHVILYEGIVLTSRPHHARVIICLLGGLHPMRLSQVGWECFRAVYEHLF